MAPSHFTREEAEMLLPRLTALILDMQEQKAEHDRCQQTVAELLLKMKGNGQIFEGDLRGAREGLEKSSARLNELIEELHGLGCELKGIDEGLVDFRTLREGREVYLCWKLGEEWIGWWHELETGFAGRQPLEGAG